MTTFLCPIHNNPYKPDQSCEWYCTSSFSSKAEIIEHFKELKDHAIDDLFDKFDRMIRSAKSADILSYDDYRRTIRYDVNVNLNENFRNMSLNNDVKPNFDYFDEKVYKNFFHFMNNMNSSEDYIRNNFDTFYNFQKKKQQFDILRIQMGSMKLYNLFYFVREVYSFLNIIEMKFQRIVAIFLYMDYNLKYGYREDINGRLYFSLPHHANFPVLHTKKDLTVSKF